MQRRMLAGMAALVLLGAVPAWALFERVYPLGEIIRDATTVATARVVSVDPVKQRAVLRVGNDLKGRTPYRRLEIDISKGGFGHAPQAMRRLAPDLPLVLFTVSKENRHMVLAYANGTWLQATAPEAKDPNTLDWQFTHCEIYLRRSFSGPTADLEQLVRDVLSGKQKAPDPNLTTPPGFGPEVPVVPAPAVAAPAAAPPMPPKAAPMPPRAAPLAPLAGVRRSGPVSAEEREKVVQLARATAFPEADVLALAEKAPLDLLDPAARLARELGGTPRAALETYAGAGNWEDTRWALRLSRDYGRGGDRDLVRTPGEILALYRRGEWLNWEDVRLALERARVWFSPLQDRAVVILDLHRRRPWDEVDWLLNLERGANVPLATLEDLRARFPRDQVQRLVDFHRARQAPIPTVLGWWSLTPSWDDLTAAMDLSRDFRGGKLEEVNALLLMRQGRDWGEMRQALQREKQWQTPVKTLWELRRRLTWQDVDTALDYAKRYQTPLPRLVELRLQGLNWTQVSQRVQMPAAKL